MSKCRIGAGAFLSCRRALAARMRVSFDRWQIAKRCMYLVMLGLSVLIVYLLWSLDEALDMLAP